MQLVRPQFSTYRLPCSASTTQLSCHLRAKQHQRTCCYHYCQHCPQHSHLPCRTSSAQPSQATPSAQPPAQSKEAAERGQSAATTAPAALSKEATDRNQGDASTTAPAAQQSAPVADRRGRPRIQWQPPTQAQAEEAVRVSTCNSQIVAGCESLHDGCGQRVL